MVSFPKIPANFCHYYFQSFKVFKKTAWCKLQTNGFKGKLFYIPVADVTLDRSSLLIDFPNKAHCHWKDSQKRM